MNYAELKSNLNTLNKESRIDELEKIKAKINLEDVDCQYEEDYVYSSGLQTAIEIIDKRISELKGEYEPDDWDSLSNAERDH